MAKIKMFILYLVGFYLIYTPNLTPLLNIRIAGHSLAKYYVLSACAIIVIMYFALIRKKMQQKIHTRCLSTLFLGIILASTYFCCRALFRTDITVVELRVVQNNFILLQLMYFIVLFDILKTIGKKTEEILKFVLNLAVIQGIICILMVIFPGLKSIALNLYYMGAEENVFISASRLYGISEDYTFGTQIYHGMLSSVTIILGVLWNKKYFVYFPFCFLASILNGRTGLLIFGACMILFFFMLILSGKIKAKTLGYVTTIFFLIIIAMQITKVSAPDTFDFIQLAISDTMNIIENGELSGTYNSLVNNMMYWPEGINFIFGAGERVYLNEKYSHSDIGYVNDMFMGGVVYCTILYSTILIFFLKCNKKQTEKWRNVNFICSIIMIVTLFIGNFKGETLKGGILLLGAIIIKLILNQEVDDERLSEHNNTSIQCGKVHSKMLGNSSESNI